MKSAERIDLAAERSRTEGLWQSGQAPYVPVSVAAAITFHQVHGNTKAIVSRDDYDDALNIAASALSRLIPILTLRDPREGRVAIAVDLVTQRFMRGATELHHKDGSRVLNLSVRSSELHSALSLIKRSGILGSSFSLSARRAESRSTEKTPKPDPENAQ